MNKNETILKNAKATTEQVSKVLSKPKTLIYCGPTINNGEISQYAVFQGNLPEHVKKHLEAEAAVKELLIPVQDFVAVKNRIYQKGTREQLLFEKALNYANGGNK